MKWQKRVPINYSEKPLNDNFRQIEIGDYPQACFSIEINTLKSKQCK